MRNRYTGIVDSFPSHITNGFSKGRGNKKQGFKKKCLRLLKLQTLQKSHFTYVKCDNTLKSRQPHFCGCLCEFPFFSLPKLLKKSQNVLLMICKDYLMILNLPMIGISLARPLMELIRPKINKPRDGSPKINPNKPERNQPKPFVAYSPVL